MNQSFRTNRVLVVDDDPITRSLIAAQLTKLACEVIEAEDGRQAWGRLTEETFDLAIVDLNMPNMNGFELIQCVRGFPRTRHLPVVVVTSHGDGNSIANALSAGATSFMTKPLAWGTFRPHIEFLLRLTNEARCARQKLHEAMASSRAKEQVLSGLCAEVAASAERITQALKQVSLRPAVPGQTSGLADRKLQSAIEQAASLRTAAETAHEILRQIPSTTDASNDKTSLNEILEGARLSLQAQSQKFDVKISVTAATGEVVMACNKSSVILALHQLMDNAIRFSRSGDSVQLSASVFPDGLIAIEVTDRGSGMSPDYIAQRLTPFADQLGDVTPGVGRGWPIAKAIAEAHNGSLEIRSMPGEGTTAYIFLPPERLIARSSASGRRAG